MSDEAEKETAGRQGAAIALDCACKLLNREESALLPLADRCTVAIISDCERRTALSVAHQAIAELGRPGPAGSSADDDMATDTERRASRPPAWCRKTSIRHESLEMRCAALAARARRKSAVKSIEV